MILDTSALSAFFAEDAGLLTLLGNTPELHVPVIVLGEYRFGLLGSRRRRTLEAKLDALEADSSVLDVDAITARHYGDIREELRRRGKPIPGNDIWIAALVRQHALEIISSDSHFDHVNGVRRRSW